MSEIFSSGFPEEQARNTREATIAPQSPLETHTEGFAVSVRGHHESCRTAAYGLPRALMILDRRAGQRPGRGRPSNHRPRETASAFQGIAYAADEVARWYDISLGLQKDTVQHLHGEVFQKINNNQRSRYLHAAPMTTLGHTYVIFKENHQWFTPVPPLPPTELL